MIKRAFFIFSLLIYINIVVFAQSNPEAFDLKSGNYKFGYWDSLSPAGTYPPNMAFQWVGQMQTSPFYSDAIADYNCDYNDIPGGRIGGLGADGFCFFGSSVSQFADCKSTVADNRFPGCAVLSLNTSNRKDINVYWKASTYNYDNVLPVKECKVRLQYRVGSSRSFRDVAGPYEYTSSMAFSDSLEIGPIPLSRECENQKLVQLRWIYFEPYSKKNTGIRPRMRVDDIYVTSSDMSTKVINVYRNDTNTVQITNDILTVDLNNYYNKDKYEITIFTPTGKSIYSTFNDEQFLKLNIAKIIKGPCIISLRNTKTDYTIYKKLYIHNKEKD